MASLDECTVALHGLSDRLRAAGKPLPDRTVSCTLPDLGTTLNARLGPDGLTGITTDEAPPAQVRLTLSSDDLVALVAGELGAMSAFGSGRLKVKASFGDLMLLRSLG